MTQTNSPIKRVRSDNGKEYLNRELQNYAESKGTIFEQTAPHSSAQNGIAERLNRTLMDFARALLAQHNLPKFLWQEAVAHVNYVRNRLPTKATGKTPHELFYGKPASLRHMEEFGAPLWVLDQSGKTRKLCHNPPLGFVRRRLPVAD